MPGTDITAGAVVEKDGKYLIVEEVASGRAVLTQPGGHLEACESSESAVERETFEESGCVVRAGDLLGVYVWTQPETQRQYLRIMHVAELVSQDEKAGLDTGIIAAHWFSEAELWRERDRLRTPAVLRAIEDYRRGQRADGMLRNGTRAVQRNLSTIIKRAAPL